MRSLDALPFDVLFGVSLYLDIEDIVNLHNSCRQLRFLLGEETLCRRLLENRARRTREAREARKSGYQAAIRRLYRRRKAVAAGIPASVASLGYAADVIYSDGVACILGESYVQVVDLHGSKEPRRIPIVSLLSGVAEPDRHCDYECVRLLSCCADVLVFTYEDDNGHCWLLAADVSNPAQPQRVIEPELLRSTHKLFVEQTGQYLFYGTRTGVWISSGQRYREWMVHGIALNGHKFMIERKDGAVEEASRTEPIQLHNFAGSDVGSTAAFKIHEGFFYAVTNCDAFDVIEVDFTSVYQCVRFPVVNPQEDTCEYARLYRRQHAEGPVNDGWNSLRLDVDERTNMLLLIEGRAEWPMAGDSLSRGFYTHEVDFERNVELGKGPADDAFSKIPDEETKYCSTPELPPWHAHVEAYNLAETPRSAGTAVPSLSRSKYRAYNFASMACLELFEKQCNCRGFNSHCLQLRSYSRRPLVSARSCVGAVQKGKQKVDDLSDLDHTGAHDYQYSKVSIWPKGPGEEHHIMNLPAEMQGTASPGIKAWMDERSIVYFIHVNGIGKVVCINFDGDSPITGYQDQSQHLPFHPRKRGYSPRLQSDPEELRYLSPSPPPFDHPVFEPHEIKEDFFAATWDLDDIPDMCEVGGGELEEWFDLLKQNCRV
ncbi:uncharacterized protein PV09_08246 [Verruconis gallopava]|uniref:F-box domain-containing protein n=1 Tax=Verruconis gallopava TaxID=253628 RepID=A0A0D1XD97_9PEZI|nr:uncharacterized protein PV09_08246 [Verruconis gallopava]KIW00206.1 hypothetical protein PV09_08246 [Verruconis gallopava]